MGADLCSIISVLGEAKSQIRRYKKGIGKKISVLESDDGGGSEKSGLGKFPLGGKGSGGLKGFIRKKITNALKGSILGDLVNMFEEGFNLDRFLDVVIKYFLLLDQKAKRERLNHPTEHYFADYEVYEDFIYNITSDPDDLIFIAKLSTEEFLEEVNRQDEIIEDIEEEIAILEAEIINLDPSFYVGNLETNLTNASAEILNAIMELGEAEVSISKDISDFNSNSYVDSENHISRAIDYAEPETSFNDIAFTSSLDGIISSIAELSARTEEIHERKGLIENFIPSFEESFSDTALDDYHLKAIINDMREIKTFIDSSIKAGEDKQRATRESVFARLWAIRLFMMTSKLDILSALEALKNLTPGGPDRENLDMLDSVVSSLGDIVTFEEEDQQDLDGIINTLNREGNIALTDPNSDQNNLTEAIEDLKAIVNKHKVRNGEYRGALEGFNPRENKHLERAMKVWKLRGYLDVIDAMKRGDWKEVFSILNNGNFGFNDFFRQLFCVLDAKSAISQKSKEVLGDFSAEMDRFESLKNLEIKPRKKVIEAAVNSLKRKKKDLDGLSGRIDDAIGSEG